MAHVRAVLGEAVAEAAGGRWREPVAALLDGKGTEPRHPARGPDPEWQTRQQSRGGDRLMTERLIVIGGGGAGISAATTAKRVNPDLKVSLLNSSAPTSAAADRPRRSRLQPKIDAAVAAGRIANKVESEFRIGIALGRPGHRNADQTPVQQQRVGLPQRAEPFALQAAIGRARGVARRHGVGTVGAVDRDEDGVGSSRVAKARAYVAQANAHAARGLVAGDAGPAVGTVQGKEEGVSSGIDRSAGQVGAQPTVGIGGHLQGSITGGMPPCL